MLDNITKVFDENTATSTGVTYDQIHYDQYKGDRNYFEKVVDQMMINKFDEEIRRQIYNLPKSERRRAIFALLGADRMIFKEIENKRRELPKMEYLKWAIYRFKDFVKIAEVDTKKFGEVLTPMPLVKEMIQTVPDDFWGNRNAKVMDCCNGNGNFLLMSIYRFMFGLKDIIPNEEERFRWIVEKMIYACELQPINMFLWIYLIDPFDEYTMNVYTGSFLKDEFDNHMKNVWGVDKFSLILGNPPYQMMDGGAKASAKPIYNLFIEKSLKICDMLLFITPSRWFAGGKGLDNFRKMMMDRKDIVLINHFDNACDIFGKEVEIKGGVSYFLINKSYNGLCNFNSNEINLDNFDIIITDIKYLNLISKILKYNNFLNKICKGRGDNIFGIQTNDKRLVDHKISEDYILCKVSLQKGFTKWINKNDVKNIDRSLFYKVITVEAATKGGQGFGNKYISYPGEVCNGSYIVFDTENEDGAKSLLSYLNTKFANKMLSLRKISQHIKPDTCKWIPIIPFDKEWTDEKLYEYFNLTKEEISLIEND